MRVGIPKEIKTREYRVAMTPAGVNELCSRGHEIFVETQAGAGVGLSDDDYKRSGAVIVESIEEVFETADLIVKVKEPQTRECHLLRKGQILFTYLHLAADPQQASLLQKSGASCIAYETVTDSEKTLPLLTPMSEVAGRLSVQAAAMALEKSRGGAGILLGGVPGVAPGQVTIIGGGVVGSNAATIALGMGAKVNILDKSLPRLRALDSQFSQQLNTQFADQPSLAHALKQSDVVIGAVLIPGASAPKIIQRDHLKLMRPGSVIVDVAIDQGGCVETSRPTTHNDPTFIVDGIVHYCVANMPGAVARTSTFALTNATLPYILRLADSGLNAFSNDAYFQEGLNVHEGKIVHPEVAQSLGVA